MSVKLQWKNFNEFLLELRALPANVREEGLVVVHEETEGAAQELRNAYGVGATGNLGRRVRTFYPSGTILAGIVRSMAPHAHLWHWGTKARETHRGLNRGKMPSAEPEPMVPIARRRRARMARRLVELLRRKGFQIGEAA